MKRLKRWQIALICAALVIALCAGAFFIYVGDYYHADAAALSAYTVSAEAADNRDVGFIFYPGGKVEAVSYDALIENLEARGFSAFLVPMPFNLAFFGVNKADEIIAAHPSVEHWYVGGHSLGGVAASIYASGSDKIEGVVLLGSYSTKDLTDKRVLSVYGSEDGVMNRKAYEENKINLPADFEEVVIEGGCHAGFGMYGAQSGDGTPKITSAEQTDITAELISRFLLRSYQ